ncbi:MAG: hypothetical protein AMS27_12420 [Bacteroides sp. SM23_62_1]|nr:MAG: hypothetical protein AMS27_12420 [Bacteroides sp. SM23_62_1]
MIEVSGDIAADTTWSADTVKVTGDVTVQDDITLTIIPGTYVEFQGYYSLRVKGSLKAEGSTGDTIIFTIKDTTGFKNMESPLGGWNRIIFDNGSSDYGADGAMNDNDSSVISFCILEYSKDTTQDRIEWGPTPEIGGGAIQIMEFSKLKITNSIFRYCRSNDFGGAIHCYRHSDIMIKGNYFTHNVAVNGGAISTVESNPLIIQNSIINNSCLRTEDQSIWSWESHGGGIFCNMMKPVIKNNDIRYNTARFGPGIACISSNPIIEENTVAYNYTFRNDGHGRGGGIYLYENSNAKIINNLISNNFAFHGGGIGCMLSNPTIFNNLIANNSSGDRGGGVECSYSSPILTNNTIVHNKAWKGGGIYCIHESYPKLLNCIV